METTFQYLRQFGPVLAERILETYPPLQSTKDPVATALQTLLRKPLPAQGLAITGTAKYLRRAKAARIVAECGAGKTFMALGTIHVLAEGRPSTTLVMCPSHITHKWAREVLLTIPHARAFLIEDMRNGGDPSRPHGICEVKLSKGKTVYEGKRLSMADMRRMGRKEWRKRFPGPSFFITGKDKGKLGYFWEHVYLKAKSGPNLGGVVNPDSGVAILDSEMQKLTALDFTDKLKVSEALTAPRGGSTRFSALWQADRTRIQRMAPIEYIGRYMRGWFDFAIADELHQLAGDTAQGNGLGVLGRAAQRLIALTGTLMGGYADDLFNIFYRMEPHAMVREGFAYGGQGRRDFQEQYGVLETIEKVEEADNACSRATKKTVRVLRKPGASPMLFGKFLMTTTAFLSLEDISDNLPRYNESVISVDMDDALQRAYEQLEEDIRSAMKAHRGNKSLMSILLNTLLLYPDHPYDFDQIWARAFDPQTKEYVKFLVTEPENLTREARYAKERALIADVKEELRQGRRCQVYATYTGEKDVTLRLEAVLRQEGIRVAVLRSSVATDKREDWYDRQLKAGVEVVICHPSTALDDLLEIEEGKINDTRLYRCLDRILPPKTKLERHLKERYGALFGAEFDVLLYDLTSTYVEGAAEKNPMVRRGYSRDHRPDCEQLVIALIVNNEGFPFSYETFDGNRSDVSTMETILRMVERKYGKARRIWVFDRGIVSEDNLAAIRKRGGQYLTGTPRSQMKRFEEELLKEDWTRVRPEVEVKKVVIPQGEETYILCRTAGRKEKENAIRNRFSNRMESVLQALENAIVTGRLKDRYKMERQLGKIQARHPQVSDLYDLDLRDTNDGVRLIWQMKEDRKKWRESREGAYLLRTNIQAETAEQLWSKYMQLTEAEASFRALKSELSIRPLFHQLEPRVKAHIMVAFLGYALWVTLKHQLKRRPPVAPEPSASGVDNAQHMTPMKAIALLSTLQSADIVLPTTDGREIRLRRITEPTTEQKSLLRQLGISLPEHLRFQRKCSADLAIA